MTLRLYLDECVYRKRLVSLLRGDPYNHVVETPVESGLLGHSDAEQFAYARSHDLILITRNPADFEALHRAEPNHPGILAIYDRNRLSDMSDPGIARAIQNLADAQVPLAGVFQSLNPWSY